MCTLLFIGILLIGAALTYGLVAPLKFILNRNAARYQKVVDSGDTSPHSSPQDTSSPGLTKEATDELIVVFRRLSKITD